MKDFVKRISEFLSSPRFFRLILVVFVFEAIWIAVSAAYPQAFDENFHFGLIQTYSHYWLPFLSSQPPHANVYGAVARDPSYLYHYLMSFPYRLIALFVHGQIGQVVLLRFINIGLLGIGLVLLRRILRRVGISRALSNISILIFTLIPVVPQLAAQINYDNLLIPLVAWTILLTFDAVDQIRARKPSAKTLIGLLSLCLFASLVKYAFLPIFLGVIVFLLVITLHSYRHRFRLLMSHLVHSWKQLSRPLKIILISLLLLGLGAFAQRDVLNVVKYHAIEPNCAKVLNVKSCSAYSAWYYNYTAHQLVEGQVQAGTINYTNPVAYALQWLYWMWYRLFFAVSGQTNNFTNYPPLPLPSAAAILITVVGTVAIIKYWRQIFHNNVYMVLLFVVSLLYVVALVAQGYATYHYTNILENMNGRYLLPVLIFAAAIVGKGLSVWLRHATNQKLLLVIVVLVLFLQGGGLLTFITRSDDTWDVQNHVVRKMNDTSRRILSPVIVNGNKTYGTSRWFFN